MTTQLPPIPEGFRLVPGYNRYCINSKGQVLGARIKEGRVIKWYPKPSHLAGYHPHQRLAITFTNAAGKRAWLIHRLVLEIFRGPCPDGMEACHNDGNPLNNSLSNLRWDTHAANMADREKHGRTAVGEKIHKSKLTEESVRQMRTMYRNGNRQADIAALFGVVKCTVSDVLNRTWKHVQ